jgi:hypothetical protein
MRKIIPEEQEDLYEEEHMPEQANVNAPVKPKRQISTAQREHLNKIRELAMKKKAELKEITLKSKLAKTVPKQDLAKQYDEYIENKVKNEVFIKSADFKQQTKKKEEVKEEEEEEVIVKKAKTKPKKKIVYVSESESEEEEVIVKKKTKSKKPQPLEHLVYNSNRDQLYNRMIEERVKNSIIGYGNALGV